MKVLTAPFREAAHRDLRRFHQQEAQQEVTLFRDMSQPSDIAAGSDGVFHALWTDTNNVQSVVWFYGSEFVPTAIHQQDIATVAGSF